MLEIPKFVFKLRKLDTQSDFNHLLPKNSEFELIIAKFT